MNGLAGTLDMRRYDRWTKRNVGWLAALFTWPHSREIWVSDEREHAWQGIGIDTQGF